MADIVILTHPSGRSVRVRPGFSWPAFVLGPLWAIAKKLWLHMALMVLAAMPLVFLEYYAEHVESIGLGLATLALELTYMIVCGRYGNRWLLASLERRGYVRSAPSAATTSGANATIS